MISPQEVHSKIRCLDDPKVVIKCHSIEAEFIHCYYGKVRMSCIIGLDLIEYE